MVRANTYGPSIQSFVPVPPYNMAAFIVVLYPALGFRLWCSSICTFHGIAVYIRSGIFRMFFFWQPQVFTSYSFQTLSFALWNAYFLKVLPLTVKSACVSPHGLYSFSHMHTREVGRAGTWIFIDSEAVLLTIRSSSEWKVIMESLPPGSQKIRHLVDGIFQNLQFCSVRSESPEMSAWLVASPWLSPWRESRLYNFNQFSVVSISFS